MGIKTNSQNSDVFKAFAETVVFCAGDKELVRQFNRLSGHHLGEIRAPIQMMIDNACGFDPDADAMPDFERFVWDCIFKPLT